MFYSSKSFFHDFLNVESASSFYSWHSHIHHIWKFFLTISVENYQMIVVVLLFWPMEFYSMILNEPWIYEFSIPFLMKFQIVTYSLNCELKKVQALREAVFIGKHWFKHWLFTSLLKFNINYFSFWNNNRLTFNFAFLI